MGFRRWFSDYILGMKEINKGLDYLESRHKSNDPLILPKGVEKPSTTLAKMIALAIIDFTKPVEVKHWVTEASVRGGRTTPSFKIVHPKFTIEGAQRGHDGGFYLYTHLCKVANKVIDFSPEERVIILDAFKKWREGEDLRKAIKAEADRQQKACDALEAWLLTPAPLPELPRQGQVVEITAEYEETPEGKKMKKYTPDPVLLTPVEK